ncbi:MAG: hypothetical protein FJ220_06500 [Kiritimatiellaceae bacterium]|nr:hypothetical protein [Kiritimatiellaceae bacterium]
MAKLLRVKLITPQEVAFDGTAVAVTIPAETGEMQVYQGHIPVLARIIKGIIRIENSKTFVVCFQADEGFFRVTPDEVSLLVDQVTPMSSGRS